MMEDKHYCVYKHTFPNGKVYIGITKQPPKYRWRSDGSGYRPQNGKPSKIWNAIQKYGWENVQHEILIDRLTKEEAENKEIYFIALYKSNCIEFGYNIAPGGCTTSPTEETKQKISNAKKGNNYGLVGERAPMYGKHHTQETKDKISAAMSGENNPFYGKRNTEEEKMRQLMRHLEYSKPIEQYDKTGALIGIYISVKDAVRKTGINRASIMAALNGKQKTAGRSIWKVSQIPAVEIFNRPDWSFSV